MSLIYEIVIFTASSPGYANSIIDYLDPNKKFSLNIRFIQHRLFRENCIITKEGYYIKDLRILNKDLKDIIIVDNLAYSYAFQVIFNNFRQKTEYQ